MNIKGHFETITRHKLLVMKYCFACGLYEQGLAHDLSKYSPTEFIPVSYTHIDVYKRQEKAFPIGTRPDKNALQIV